MGKVAWQPIYSVHVKELDAQHIALIEFMNEVYRNLDAGMYTTGDSLSLIDKLYKHAEVHFGTEEEYFAKFSYPESEVHIAEHNRIKHDLLELRKKHERNNKIDVLFEILQFLDDWVLVHIMEYDKRYTKCFNEHGLF